MLQDLVTIYKKCLKLPIALCTVLTVNEQMQNGQLLSPPNCETEYVATNAHDAHWSDDHLSKSNRNPNVYVGAMH